MTLCFCNKFDAVIWRGRHNQFKISGKDGPMGATIVDLAAARRRRTTPDEQPATTRPAEAARDDSLARQVLAQEAVLAELRVHGERLAAAVANLQAATLELDRLRHLACEIAELNEPSASPAPRLAAHRRSR